MRKRIRRLDTVSTVSRVNRKTRAMRPWPSVHNSEVQGETGEDSSQVSESESDGQRLQPSAITGQGVGLTLLALRASQRCHTVKTHH